MARYQPTQGPGEGLKLGEVATTVINTGSDRVRGRAARLITGAAAGAPIYGEAAGLTPADVDNGLVCVLEADAADTDRVGVVVVGLANGLLGTGGGALNQYMSVANATGTFIPAVIGDRVVARCLEAGNSGDVVLLDFDGDRGFGVLS